MSRTQPAPWLSGSPYRIWASGSSGDAHLTNDPQRKEYICLPDEPKRLPYLLLMPKHPGVWPQWTCIFVFTFLLAKIAQFNAFYESLSKLHTQSLCPLASKIT